MIKLRLFDIYFFVDYLKLSSLTDFLVTQKWKNMKTFYSKQMEPK